MGEKKRKGPKRIEKLTKQMEEQHLYYSCPYCGYEKCERDDVRCGMCDALLIEDFLNDYEDDFENVYDPLEDTELSAVDAFEDVKEPEKPEEPWKKRGAAGGKIFILDTCTLMQTDGMAIFGFGDNEVNVTMTTLEELDNLKNSPGESGYQARASIRVIDSLREDGFSYRDGIPINRGGAFRIVDNTTKDGLLPRGWSYNKPDNRIIATVINNNAHADILKCRSFLVTQDNCMRLKAVCAGCDAQAYKNEEADEVAYTGRTEVVISRNDIDDTIDEDVMPMMDRFWEDRKLEWNQGIAYENEYFTLLDGNQKALARYNGGYLRPISQKSITYASPNSDGQRFALDALLTPASEIPLVLLIGAAGCGKTYLSIAAGLNGVYAQKGSSTYDTMIITRPNAVPAGEELGFLPGSIEDKMDPLLAPFYDNLRSMLLKDSRGKREQVDAQVKEITQDYVKIVSLGYIRGRSIPNAYIIVDEAQNLTVQQAKTLVTRCGKGTKLVLCGDPDQIDQARLSKRNNGLVYIAEKLRGQPLMAQLTFDMENETSRSPLASMAAKRL
ncbi:MAG: PhoH family protein [Lachnospiraceae bacterium]|nr:PhoH family protein [Lachnospiraceae bacterium]